MLTPKEANELAADLIKDHSAERVRLSRLTRYMRGRQADPYLPAGTDREYRQLARSSAANWLQLVIRAVSQGLIVDGFGGEKDSVVWVDGWQANGLDARQQPLHDAALVHGYAFNLLMPVGDGVWIRPDSATNVAARYANPDDEWPQAAARSLSRHVVELYDETAQYTLVGTLGRSEVSVVEHNLGRTPVVRVMSELSLLGTPQGEIEQVTPIQDRIVDATFNLQMVAKYGAFPQRWIAGMKAPVADDSGDVPIESRIRAYVDSILMAEDADTKFGQFSAADLKQFVEALEAHIRHLAAITQTPPHYLLGSMVNLSAEALAAAESGLQRKIRSRREVIGEGWEQTLRLAAVILGADDVAADVTAQVHWQDVESRSLAQTSDALLKLGQLGVPAEKLFHMIPGWTKTDADDAAAMVNRSGGLLDLARQALDAQVSPPLPDE